MNPRNHEVARMVVDVPSGGGDGGDCGGRGRDRGGSAATASRAQYCSLRGRVFWAIFMVSNKSVAICAQTAIKSRGAGHACADEALAGAGSQFRRITNSVAGQSLRLVELPTHC